MITQEKLKEHLLYNSETGIFTWINSFSRRVKVGSVAGTMRQGYVDIRINNKNYGSHRLAWLYVYGVMPKGFIDHINRDRTDNRICNLREASKLENSRNVTNKSSNTSGYRGVNWNKSVNKWEARIRNNYKRIHLGFFDNVESASIAYENKAKEIHNNFYSVG